MYEPVYDWFIHNGTKFLVPDRQTYKCSYTQGSRQLFKADNTAQKFSIETQAFTCLLSGCLRLGKSDLADPFAAVIRYKTRDSKTRNKLFL